MRIYSLKALKQGFFKLMVYPLLLIAVGSLIPYILSFNQYYILISLQIVVLASIALSWNIIGGYAGQLDLASFAYLGLGGIIATELMIKYNITPWIGMFIGALSAVGLAFLIGYPLFRFGIREVWYALSTAALVIIIHELSLLILGPYDYYIPPVEGWYYLKFRTWENMYYISLVFLAIVVMINLWIGRSKLGYYLKAIREDELAAEAIGINVRKYKLLALMIYAALVGFIGYVYVVSQRTYSYKTFSGPMSVYVAIVGIVGGLGSVSGTLTASIILKLAEEYLRATFGGTLPGLHYLIYGLLLILVGILMPEGLATITTRISKLVRNVLGVRHEF